jgi:hypothetical protein
LAGDEGFDPLGLSNIDDLGIDLYWMREAELKHSRVAMLAVVGALAQEVGFVLPGMVSLSHALHVFCPTGLIVMIFIPFSPPERTRSMFSGNSSTAILVLFSLL